MKKKLLILLLIVALIPAVATTVFADPDWPHQERSINEMNEFTYHMFFDYIKSQVGDDEALLAKVTPDYAPMGKRTLQDNGSWLAALKRDNVELVPQGAVKRIIYEGMQTVVQF